MSTHGPIAKLVYLNGEFVPIGDALISVEDRGFLLGDACYEATPIYRGACVLLDDHLSRLQRGLDETRIAFVAESLREMHGELLNRNDMKGCPFGLVYVQITRGVAPRTHSFPVPPVPPTVYAFAKEVRRPTSAEFRRGCTAISYPDMRWMLPRIKTTGLLPNVLAEQAAVDAGVDGVVLHRDGSVTEGAHSNVFIVQDGRLITAPADDSILHGVTRRFIIDLAHKLSIGVDERPFTIDELYRADEAFFTGTTTEVRAIVAVDQIQIGAGAAGSVTTRLREQFLEAMRAAITGGHGLMA